MRADTRAHAAARNNPSPAPGVTTLRILRAELTAVFEAIGRHPIQGDLVWHGADMCSSLSGVSSDYDSATFRIGDTATVLQLLGTVPLEDLEVGVFIGLPRWVGAEAIPEMADTDGPSGQRAPASVIEVAVTDGVVAVTSDHLEVLQDLRGCFPGARFGA